MSKNIQNSIKETLQDITKYYFGQKLNKIYIPNQLKIPTSQIIEIALKNKSPGNNGFAGFKKELITLLK